MQEKIQKATHVSNQSMQELTRLCFLWHNILKADRSRGRANASVQLSRQVCFDVGECIVEYQWKIGARFKAGLVLAHSDAERIESDQTGIPNVRATGKSIINANEISQHYGALNRSRGRLCAEHLQRRIYN